MRLLKVFNALIDIDPIMTSHLREFEFKISFKLWIRSGNGSCPNWVIKNLEKEKFEVSDSSSFLLAALLWNRTFSDLLSYQETPDHKKKTFSEALENHLREQHQIYPLFFDLSVTNSLAHTPRSLLNWVTHSILNIVSLNWFKLRYSFAIFHRWSDICVILINRCNLVIQIPTLVHKSNHQIRIEFFRFIWKLKIISLQIILYDLFWPGRESPCLYDNLRNLKVQKTIFICWPFKPISKLFFDDKSSPEKVIENMSFKFILISFLLLEERSNLNYKIANLNFKFGSFFNKIQIDDSYIRRLLKKDFFSYFENVGILC